MRGRGRNGEQCTTHGLPRCPHLKVDGVQHAQPQQLQPRVGEREEERHDEEAVDKRGAGNEDLQQRDPQRVDDSVPGGGVGAVVDAPANGAHAGDVSGHDHEQVQVVVPVRGQGQPSNYLSSIVNGRCSLCSPRISPEVVVGKVDCRAGQRRPQQRDSSGDVQDAREHKCLADADEEEQCVDDEREGELQKEHPLQSLGVRNDW